MERPRTAQTTANIDAVDELVLRQEDAPQTHSTVQQSATETRIHPPGSTNSSSSTASMLAVVRAVLGLPLPDFLIIDPVCVKRLIKSFNVLFFHPLAGTSFVNLTAS